MSNDEYANEMNRRAPRVARRIELEREHAAWLQIEAEHERQMRRWLLEKMECGKTVH